MEYQTTLKEVIVLYGLVWRDAHEIWLSGKKKSKWQGKHIVSEKGRQAGRHVGRSDRSKDLPVLPLSHGQCAAAPSCRAHLNGGRKMPTWSPSPHAQQEPRSCRTGHPICSSSFPPTAQGMTSTSFPLRLAHMGTVPMLKYLMGYCGGRLSLGGQFRNTVFSSGSILLEMMCFWRPCVIENIFIKANFPLTRVCECIFPWCPFFMALVVHVYLHTVFSLLHGRLFHLTDSLGL